jgi:hypothetical protein
VIVVTYALFLFAKVDECGIFTVSMTASELPPEPEAIEARILGAAKVVLGLLVDEFEPLPDAEVSDRNLLLMAYGDDTVLLGGEWRRFDDVDPALGADICFTEFRYNWSDGEDRKISRIRTSRLMHFAYEIASARYLCTVDLGDGEISIVDEIAQTELSETESEQQYTKINSYLTKLADTLMLAA